MDHFKTRNSFGFNVIILKILQQSVHKLVSLIHTVSLFKNKFHVITHGDTLDILL